MTRSRDPSPGQLRRAWNRFRKDRTALLALVFLVIVGMVALLHSHIQPYPPHDQLVGPPFSDPSWDHLLGTDQFGRDILSRILEGAAVSIRFSVVVIGCVLVVSVPLGLLSGYVGGVVDTALMRVMDAMMAIPGLVLAIALVSVVGTGESGAIVAIGVVMTPGFTRLVRARALAVREETFIEASRTIGTPSHRVLAGHVFPNTLSPLIVQASIGFGLVVLAEAGLSFLGLGAQPPTASWGVMLRDSTAALLTHPWQTIPPGLAISLCVLGFNMLGDGLRAALRPAAPVRKSGRLGITTVANAETSRRRPRLRTHARPNGPASDAAPASGLQRSADRAEPDVLLDVQSLTIRFDLPAGSLDIVDNVSFSVRSGETLGLVGESGSGKTVTSLALMRLLPSPPATIEATAMTFDGHDLLTARLDEMACLRGSDIAMIFQNPMSSLNPAQPVQRQIAEVVRWHEGVSHKEAKRRALEALEHVGVPRSRGGSYPHELSGGMRQRSMIAMALVCRPKLLIADEPTTALDVTIQAQILELLRSLQSELGMAMIFVTHDLGVVADICDRVAVMYAGEIVETAGVYEYFTSPRHPYSEGLLRAMPQRAERGSRLYSIPGQVPQFHELGAGCRLVGRCVYATDACEAQRVTLHHVGPDHESACVRSDELELVAE